MSRTSFWAWRFFYPDLDTPKENAGLRFTTRGSVELASGAEAVRQAILLLMSTRPGERVMRPEYGCALHTLLFAPNDDTTAGLAVHYTRQALERWEPRIEILRLEATRDPVRDTCLMLQLEYRIKSIRPIDQLTLTLNLVGDMPGGA